MRLDAKAGTFLGEYVIEGFRLGKKVFCHEVHNLVMDRLTTYQLSNWTQPRGASYIYFGSGSAEPTSSDSAMTTPLWNISGSVVGYSLSDDLLTGSFIYEVTVPATSSYVGSIKEVGIYSDQLGLATHSLIVDAGGNPITIEKDDLLELKVRYTIYWKAPGVSNNLRITALPALVHIAAGHFPNIGGGLTQRPRLYVLTTRGTYMRTLEGHKVFFGNEVWGRSDYGSQSWDSTHRTLTFRGVRIPAAEYNTAFLEHIALGLSIAIEAEFPNLSLIPLQTLSGMEVGQGDGQTTDFKPPLPFWIEDSEKIYVDGVLQVANVDYTCDFYNNLSGHHQLRPTANALLVGGEIAGSDGAGKFLHLRWENSSNAHSGDGKRDPEEAFSTRMCPYNALAWARPTTHCIGLTTAKPLIFELLLDEDSSKDFSMDTLVLEEQNYNNWTARVYCSDDAETWELIGEQAMSDRGASQIPRGRNTFTFTRRTKRYWKIEYVSGNMRRNSSYNNINTYLYVYGYHTGQKISFTNPPAVGSVITMDAQIDRPYKNNVHVLDYNPILQV